MASGSLSADRNGFDHFKSLQVKNNDGICFAVADKTFLKFRSDGDSMNTRASDQSIR